jgi:RNA polymerase sigma-70 factor (ECF subfamily)
MPQLEIQPTDETLVTAARGGDRQAFGRLVERYFSTVWTMAYARLRRRSCADDVAQEVFLVAFLRLESLSDGRRFGGWLGRITRNRAVDWLRQKQRSSQLVAMVSMESLEDVTAAQDPAMDQEEEHQAVRDAIFALPQAQREIVLLRFAEGLNHTQIAQRLEIHPVTVGRHLEKAMATMRTTLESVVEESVQELKPSRRAIVQTTALAAAVAQLPGASRAALAKAARQMAPRPAGMSLLKGALQMAATEKLKSGVIAIILLILGIGIVIVKTNSQGAGGAPPVNSVATTAAGLVDASRPKQRMTFTDGTVVEVLGIQNVPQDPSWLKNELGLQSAPPPDAKWWSPDGLECPAPEHEARLRVSINGAGPPARLLRIMLRMSGPRAGGEGAKAELLPNVRVGYSSYGPSHARLIELMAAVPVDTTIGELRVGVAAGQWINDVKYDMATAQYTASANAANASVRIGNVTQENRETLVEVYWPPNDGQRDRRLTVVTRGREIQSSHGHGDNPTYEYFRCAKSDMTQIICQSRPYETMAMKNLSLAPSTLPTDVQVSPLTPSTTAPASKGGG